VVVDPKSTVDFILYGAPYCHLCDDAKIVLDTISGLNFEVIDISSSFDLKKAYGMRIPVFKNNLTQLELNWPFDTNAILEFIRP